MNRTLYSRIVIVVLLLAMLLGACGGTPSGQGETVTLTLAAYTTPREAYAEIIPLFQEYWLDETGQTVLFEESYLGSGAQSRAVVEGFEADIVALSLEADVTRIAEAGLITHDWKNNSHKGIITTSVVSFAVRTGNPLNIQDWDDLAQPGVGVLTPNPRTSGGAMWNLLALYGALQRGQVAGVAVDDPGAQEAFVINLLRNVVIFDKSARDSMINFEQGVGDVAITYENEVLVGQQAGLNYELVIPASTILIENPIAIVDAYTDKHGNREVAEAFIEFLLTPEIQAVFARYGLRSIDPQVALDTASEYPPVPDLFTIDYFGGWGQAPEEYFGENGIFTQALFQVQGATP